MKNLVYVGLAGLLASGFMFSCRKKITEKSKLESTISTYEKSSNEISTQLILSDKINDFNYIGQLHNFELEQLILKTQDLSSKDDKLAEIKSYVKEKGADIDLVLLSDQFETSLNLIENLKGKYNIPEYIYIDIKDFLIQVNTIYNNSTITNKLEKIIEITNNKKEYIYTNNTGENLYLLKSFYSIYLQSSIFWSSKSQGGLGKYNEYFDNPLNGLKQDNINDLASKDAVAGLFAGIGSLGNPFVAICAAAGASIIAAM